MHLILAAILCSLQFAAAWWAQPQKDIPIGVAIHSCTQKDVVALTFDDGPFHYTDLLLDLLSEAGFTATFFVNGKNWANIQDYRSTIIRMVKEGHQVASHTYSHPNLANLDEASVKLEMTKLEDEFIKILGKFPIYMRPPYLSHNSQTLKVLGELGYHVIDTDIDTLDWQHNAPHAVGQSLDLFSTRMWNGGSIVLMHDIHRNTVMNLVPLIIKRLLQSGKRAVTIGECLGDPKKNWYRNSRSVVKYLVKDHSKTTKDWHVYNIWEANKLTWSE
ncbi:NodB-like proteiny domain-containing protein [Fusarium sp. Ph1]|nr:NodB-like proteiny domain-containing protein [Fusarium sp. Ph1]